MADKIRVTIHTERGEQTIEIDARVAGSMSNGVYEEYGRLFDGHGNLLDPRNKDIADDLSKAGQVLRETFDSVAFKPGRPEGYIPADLADQTSPLG